MVIILLFFAGTNISFIPAKEIDKNTQVKLENLSKAMAFSELLARATSEASYTQPIRHYCHNIRLHDGSNAITQITQKFEYSSSMLNEAINNALEIENSLTIEILKIILQTIKTKRKHGGNYFNLNLNNLSNPQRKALYKSIQLIIKKILYKSIKNNVNSRIPRRIIRVFIFSLLTALSKSLIYQNSNHFNNIFIKSLIRNAILEGWSEILITEIEAA